MKLSDVDSGLNEIALCNKRQCNLNPGSCLSREPEEREFGQKPQVFKELPVMEST